jgi:hypothetical protein
VITTSLWRRKCARWTPNGKRVRSQRGSSPWRTCKICGAGAVGLIPPHGYSSRRQSVGAGGYQPLGDVQHGHLPRGEGTTKDLPTSSKNVLATPSSLAVPLGIQASHLEDAVRKHFFKKNPVTTTVASAAPTSAPAPAAAAAPETWPKAPSVAAAPPFPPPLPGSPPAAAPVTTESVAPPAKATDPDAYFSHLLN